MPTSTAVLTNPKTCSWKGALHSRLERHEEAGDWADGTEVVLVVDAGIRACSRSSSAAQEERLPRVLTSAWMQRLWTLQEALFARNLVFEFSDHVLLGIQERPQGEEFPDVLKTSLAAEMFHLSKRQDYSQKGMFGIGDVVRSLTSRTTSKLEDETLAVSSLMNVNAFELVNLPAEKRMMTLLLRVCGLSSNIIFFLGLKLDELGFGWAPRTFTIRSEMHLGTSETNAVYNEGFACRIFLHAL